MVAAAFTAAAGTNAGAPEIIVPGVPLHQDSAAGIQQFGDQVRVLLELMDKQVA